MTAAPLPVRDPAIEQSLFLRQLVALWRAQDAYGIWEKRSDADLLAPYVVDREKRRQIPLIGEPDRQVIARLEQFYNAVALCIEQRTGIVASPMMVLSDEGFGRIVLIAGRLVAVSRPLRDVHRFGFDSMAKASAEGDKLVEAGVGMIERFRAVAEA